MSNEWIQKLKPGDLVIVSGGYAGDYIAKVSKVGKRHITVGASDKYRVDDGSKVSSDRWTRRRLKEISEDAIRDIKAKEHRLILLNRFRNFRWDRLEIDTLDRIASLLDDQVDKEKI